MTSGDAEALRVLTRLLGALGRVPGTWDAWARFRAGRSYAAAGDRLPDPSGDRSPGAAPSAPPWGVVFPRPPSQVFNRLFYYRSVSAQDCGSDVLFIVNRSSTASSFVGTGVFSVTGHGTIAAMPVVSRIPRYGTSSISRASASHALRHRHQVAISAGASNASRWPERIDKASPDRVDRGGVRGGRISRPRLGVGGADIPGGAAACFIVVSVPEAGRCSPLSPEGRSRSHVLDGRSTRRVYLAVSSLSVHLRVGVRRQDRHLDVSVDLIKSAMIDLAPVCRFADPGTTGPSVDGHAATCVGPVAPPVGATRVREMDGSRS